MMQAVALPMLSLLTESFKSHSISRLTPASTDVNSYMYLMQKQLVNLCQCLSKIVLKVCNPENELVCDKLHLQFSPLPCCNNHINHVLQIIV